jgi:hypothetical protein
MVRLVARSYFLAAIVSANPWIFPVSRLGAQDAHFHNAPASSNQLKSPDGGRTQRLQRTAWASLGRVVKGKVFEISGLRRLAVEGLVP